MKSNYFSAYLIKYFIWFYAIMWPCTKMRGKKCTHTHTTCHIEIPSNSPSKDKDERLKECFAVCYTKSCLDCISFHFFTLEIGLDWLTDWRTKMNQHKIIHKQTNRQANRHEHNMPFVRRNVNRQLQFYSSWNTRSHHSHLNRFVNLSDTIDIDVVFYCCCCCCFLVLFPFYSKWLRQCR